MGYELHQRRAPFRDSLAGHATTMRAARAWLVEGAEHHAARLARLQGRIDRLVAAGHSAVIDRHTLSALGKAPPRRFVVVDRGPDRGRRLTLHDFDIYIDHYEAEGR